MDHPFRQSALDASHRLACSRCLHVDACCLRALCLFVFTPIGRCADLAVKHNGFVCHIATAVQCQPKTNTLKLKGLTTTDRAEISGEAAKGADLWSIFTLTGFTAEEACRIYEDAAEHDTPFSFPVTMKDKSESFTMIFRFAGLSLHQRCDTKWQFISATVCWTPLCPAPPPELYWQ